MTSGFIFNPHLFLPSVLSLILLIALFTASGFTEQEEHIENHYILRVALNKICIILFSLSLSFFYCMYLAAIFSFVASSLHLNTIYLIGKRLRKLFIAKVTMSHLESPGRYFNYALSADSHAFLIGHDLHILELDHSSCLAKFLFSQAFRTVLIESNAGLPTDGNDRLHTIGKFHNDSS
jgi:hypothetical protein